MPTLDRKWWTLIAVCTAIFMLLLDITIVNVALPSIQRSLHASFGDLQWVVDAYALTLAAFMLTAGVIGDMFGRREMFAVGLGIFSVSSFLCGVSTSSLMLNLCRGAQGIGGAIMFATSLALIAEAFQGRERGTAFGIYGAVVGGAVAVGPLLGGAITSGIGWRWIFFVNVPIGVVAVAVTLAKVAESRDPATRRIDWAGFVTFSAALFLLVFALVRGNTSGWASPLIVGLFAGAAVLFVAFLVAEHRQADPMLDLSLFRRPAMVGVSLNAFCISASIFAIFLYLTLYLQDDLGYGPLAAGIRFLPTTMLSFLVAPLAGRLSVRIQSRYLLGTGLLVVAVGLALMTAIGPHSTWVVLLPGFVVAGIGVGLDNPVLASAAIAVVPPERSGMASGANSTFRQVGVATGIAGLGTVFASQVRNSVSGSLAASPDGRAVLHQHGAQLSTALTSGQFRTVTAGWPASQVRALDTAFRSGFATTLDHLLWIGAAVALAGSMVSYLLVRQRDFVPTGQPAGGSKPSGHGGQHGAGGPGRPGGGPGGGPGGAPEGPGGGTRPPGRPSRPDGPAHEEPAGAPVVA